MNAVARILCLGLCLALCLSAAPSLAKETKKQTQQSKSGKSSKAKGSKKSSGKNSSEKSKRKGPSDALSKNGFRGLAWGTPLTALNEPDLREKSGEMEYYTLPGDDPAVLGVNMREIVYVFCKGKLAGALTRYDGAINHMALLGKLNDTYGTPMESQPNVQGDRSWRFDNEDTSIVMEYSEKGTTGALAWMARDRLTICQPSE